MKLSTQEEYGLRCLLQLARHGDSASLTISEMSQREGISAPNVAKILRLLRRASLLTSTRGKAGGYTLARSASQITVGEVLAALGGRLWDPAFCERHAGGSQECANLGECSIRPVLRYVQEAIDHVLAQLSLADLLATETEVVAVVRPRSKTLPLVGRLRTTRPL